MTNKTKKTPQTNLKPLVLINTISEVSSPLKSQQQIF